MPDETPAGAAPAETVAPTSATPQPAPSPELVSRPEFEAALERVTAAVSGEIQKLGKSLKQSQRDVVEDRVGKMIGKYFPAPAQSQTPAEPPAPSAPPQAPPAAQVNAPSALETEIAGILSEHRLSGTEPELAELLKSKQGQPWYKVGSEFAQLAATIAARNTGSAAGVVAPPGATPPGPNLAQQYVDEIAAARAAGRFGAAELRKIKEKYRAQKLDVDNIRFEIAGVPVIARGKTEGLK